MRLEAALGRIPAGILPTIRRCLRRSRVSIAGSLVSLTYGENNPVDKRSGRGAWLRKDPIRASSRRRALYQA